MRSRRPKKSQDDQVHLRVKGRNGPTGSLEFFTQNRVLAEVFLPAQQFLIVKWLAEEAQLAAEGSGSTGFLASDVLAKRLYYANQAADFGRHVATKAVHRLRNNPNLQDALARVFDLRDENGRAVTPDLIESRRHFGYRLALIPPGGIHIPGPGDEVPLAISAGHAPPAPHFQSAATVRKGC